MARDLILGGCSYAIFSLLTAHPFLNMDLRSIPMNAQDITNWLTAALAVATVWLGVETRRMAITAKASIELETRPYLSFRGFHIKIGTLQDISTQNRGGLRIGLRLFNPGKVLVTYKVESMIVSVNGAEAADPKFETMSGVIHPTEEILFFYPVIGTPSPLKAPATAEVKFRIAYWSIPAEKKTLTANVQVLLTSETDHEWTYIEGPDYT
jgi:hypothetical protein